jgi:hypothetical protein
MSRPLGALPFIGPPGTFRRRISSLRSLELEVWSFDQDEDNRASVPSSSASFRQPRPLANQAGGGLGGLARRKASIGVSSGNSPRGDNKGDEAGLTSVPPPQTIPPSASAARWMGEGARNGPSLTPPSASPRPWAEAAMGCCGQSRERQSAIISVVRKKAVRQQLVDSASCPDTGKFIFLLVLI